jgi:Fur family ferric uptake transcriptional regulator
MHGSPDYIASQIRERGFRITPQRMAILNALHESGGHFLPLEIFEKACVSLPGITEPTIYRTLDFLVEIGFVSVTHVRGRRLEYELTQHKHHHLVCSVCGQEEELSHEWLQMFRDQLEQITGFSLTENQITFTGLCRHCK